MEDDEALKIKVTYKVCENQKGFFLDLKSQLIFTVWAMDIILRPMPPPPTHWNGGYYSAEIVNFRMEYLLSSHSQTSSTTKGLSIRTVSWSISCIHYRDVKEDSSEPRDITPSYVILLLRWCFLRHKTLFIVHWNVLQRKV